MIQCIKNYELIISESDIDINFKIDNGDFTVNADESSIEIVLNNLISNAIKYNNDNKIEIFLLKRQGRNIILSICNGIKDISKEEHR